MPPKKEIYISRLLVGCFPQVGLSSHPMMADRVYTFFLREIWDQSRRGLAEGRGDRKKERKKKKQKERKTHPVPYVHPPRGTHPCGLYISSILTTPKSLELEGFFLAMNL